MTFLEQNFIPLNNTYGIIFIVSIAMILLYLGRDIVHKSIRAFFFGGYRFFKVLSRSIMSSAQTLQERNREVLLELGQEQTERQIEREFYRINKVVTRDLGTYPELQRIMNEQITKIEEDYAKSGEVPPPSPEWLDAIQAVAELAERKGGDRLGGNVLEEIHKTTQKQHKRAMDEYRKQIAERHQILLKLNPYWRRLANTVDHVGSTIQGLMDRSQHIDTQMDRYMQIHAGEDSALRMLRASSISQFAIALIVVTIAVGGAFINFHLIALPMSETVSAAGRIAGMRVSDVAAMLVILLEASFGILLMESLRITRLFPAIGSMEDKKLKRMAWIFFIFILSFAFVEAALAFMRDEIAADNAALRKNFVSSASDSMETTTISSWIPMTGQMIMGFILPFALAFVAIPLESLIHSFRTVSGDLLVLLLKGLSALMRMLAQLFRQTGEVLVHLVDLIVIVPLQAERGLKSLYGSTKNPHGKNPKKHKEVTEY